MPPLVVHRMEDDSHSSEDSAALAHDKTIAESFKYCLNGEERPFLLVLPLVPFWVFQLCYPDFLPISSCCSVLLFHITVIGTSLT